MVALFTYSTTIQAVPHAMSDEEMDEVCAKGSKGLDVDMVTVREMVFEFHRQTPTMSVDGSGLLSVKVAARDPAAVHVSVGATTPPTAPTAPTAPEAVASTVASSVPTPPSAPLLTAPPTSPASPTLVLSAPAPVSLPASVGSGSDHSAAIAPTQSTVPSSIVSPTASAVPAPAVPATSASAAVSVTGSGFTAMVGPVPAPSPVSPATTVSTPAALTPAPSSVAPLPEAGAASPAPTIVLPNLTTFQAKNGTILEPINVTAVDAAVRVTADVNISVRMLPQALLAVQRNQLLIPRGIFGGPGGLTLPNRRSLSR